MNGLNLPVCWTCPGPNAGFTTDGQSIVATGGMEDADSFIEGNLDRDALRRRDEGDALADRIDGFTDAPSDGVTSLNPETEHALLRILQIIANMRKSELLVFHGLLNGLTLTSASTTCGFTKQNGSRRIQCLVARFPELGAFVSSCHKGTQPPRRFAV